jgi:hypothetical protein
MNRREHSHLCILTQSVTFSRNVYRQSLVRTSQPLSGSRGSADSAAHVSLSSFFSCQRTDTANALSWPLRCSAAALRVSLTRLSGCHQQGLLEANFSAASGAPPSLWAVYRAPPFTLSTHRPNFFELFTTPSSNPSHTPHNTAKTTNSTQMRTDGGTPPVNAPTGAEGQLGAVPREVTCCPLHRARCWRQ